MHIDHNASHLRSLTSLRFVAAVLVLLFHLSVYVPSLPLLGRLMGAGFVGVSFFFVLSGFVLTYSWDLGSGATRFYRRRLARVYPLHLLFIVVAVLPFSPAPLWSALPANALLLQSWSPDDAVARSFTGVSWSLSCEFFFYAVFPLLIPWLWRVRRPLALSSVLVMFALAVGVALQALRSDWGLWLFHLPVFRIVEFVCGSLAAIAVLRGRVPRLGGRWAALSVLLSYVGILVLPLGIGYRLEDRWALTLLMVPSFTCLILACAQMDLSGASSPLRGRTMVGLGQWSFCIYMAHPVVIALTLPLLAPSTHVASVLACVLVLLTVVGVSYLLHATFEQPLERRLRGSDRGRVSSDAGLAPDVVPPSLQRHGPSTLARSRGHRDIPPHGSSQTSSPAQPTG